MNKKMTVVEMYSTIIAKAEGILSAEEIEFLNTRAELHAKKNSSRKPTKAQTENEELKSKILAFMEMDKEYTISEIQKGVGIEVNQKASALVRQLKEAGKVDRKEIKGRAYFSLA